VGASTSLPDAPTSAPRSVLRNQFFSTPFPHPLSPDKDPAPAGSLSWARLCPHAVRGTPRHVGPPQDWLTNVLTTRTPTANVFNVY
jgi:hypothetical protein